MERATGRANGLDERLFERFEALPANPPAGNYVVIDVLHFSNTVLELLANGASPVHITDQRGQEPAFKALNPAALIGGSRTPDFEPEPGYDFYNSPSYVQQLDVAGRPASFWSSNGGRALVGLRSRDRADIEVYVGSTMNARAVGHHLRAQSDPTYLVAAGSRGELAVEDLVGATLISRYLDGLPPSETELELFGRQVRQAKGQAYVESHPRRRRDVEEYAMHFNSRDLVPKLTGETLHAVETADSADQALAGAD